MIAGYRYLVLACCYIDMNIWYLISSSGFISIYFYHHLVWEIWFFVMDVAWQVYICENVVPNKMFVKSKLCMWCMCVCKLWHVFVNFVCSLDSLFYTKNKRKNDKTQPFKWSSKTNCHPIHATAPLSYQPQKLPI